MIIDDVITTGTSIRKMIKTLESQEAKIVGVGVLFDRGNIKEVLEMPVTALIHLNLEAWEKEKCPLCKSGSPIDTKLEAGKSL